LTAPSVAYRMCATMLCYTRIDTGSNYLVNKEQTFTSTDLRRFEWATPEVILQSAIHSPAACRERIEGHAPRKHTGQSRANEYLFLLLFDRNLSVKTKSRSVWRNSYPEFDTFLWPSPTKRRESLAVVPGMYNANSPNAMRGYQ
jgi:hypothetical protein